MSADEICATGMGMVSSLGLDVASSCAAARAGLDRGSELTVASFSTDAEFGGEPVVGHTVPEVADGFVGSGKVLLLGTQALRDLLQNTPLGDPERKDLGFVLNLSDHYILDRMIEGAAEPEDDEPPELEEEDLPPLPAGSGFPSLREWKEASLALPAGMLAGVGLEVDAGRRSLHFGGHSGFVHAVREAVDGIQNGRFGRCIVGGVDSYIEGRFLKAAAARGILKTSANPAGLMPGEGAAFVLLEPLKAAGSAKELPGCRIRQLESFDGDPDRFCGDPSIGIGLAQVIQRVLSHDTGSRFGESGFVLGDLNGDDFRATDWGYAVTRLQSKFGVGDAPLWIPALSFGDAGAAMGPFSVCMASRAFQRGYAPARSALVWLWSERGSRAALLLDRIGE